MTAGHKKAQKRLLWFILRLTHPMIHCLIPLDVVRVSWRYCTTDQCDCEMFQIFLLSMFYYFSSFLFTLYILWFQFLSLYSLHVMFSVHFFLLSTFYDFCLASIKFTFYIVWFQPHFYLPSTLYDFSLKYFYFVDVVISVSLLPLQFILWVLFDYCFTG